MKLPNKNVLKELEIVRNAIAQFKEGIGIDELEHVTEISRRKLQRRLKVLAEENLIDILGNSVARLYTISGKKKTSAVRLIDQEGGVEMPMSLEGSFVWLNVSKDITDKVPVSYNINLLQSYRPNVDSYLSGKDKEYLSEIGQTEQLNQPAGTYAKGILQRLLIDLSWNSSRLEGNTYSLLDTKRLLSDHEVIENKSATDTQMILNHKDAIEFIVENVNEIGFNRYTITNLHGLLSHNLLPDPAASGRLRNHAIGITNSVYTPLAIPQQIEEMFDLMLKKAEEIDNPFEQAFFIMFHLPYLQPFDDVNKRVSRLAANIPLNKHNLAPMAFVNLPQGVYIKGMLGVYELNKLDLIRDVFIWAYEQSAKRYAAIRQTLGEPDPFRVKYRDIIRETVMSSVKDKMDKAKASDFINQAALKLPKEDQSKFVEAVETELLSLHEGNFARYKVRPSEFFTWKERWDK